MKAYDLDTGSEVADLYQTITYLPQHGYPQRVRVMLQCNCQHRETHLGGKNVGVKIHIKHGSFG